MIDFTWGSPARPLRITADERTPVMVSLATDVVASEPGIHRGRPAFVEVLAVGEGRGMTSLRGTRTTIGDRLRHVSHDVETAEGVERLRITQRDEVTGLVITSVIERFTDVDAYRMRTTVRNDGGAPVSLQQVTTGTLIGLGGLLGAVDELDLWTAQSEWCAENRWARRDLGGAAGLVEINTVFHDHPGRGVIELTSNSTWSSGAYLPVAVLESRASGASLAWEVENSGPWRWELDTVASFGEPLALALLGPTDTDHSWLLTLAAGASFTTVPASFAISDEGLEGAIAQLTAHRRRSHLPTTADAGRPLIFNDYMNCLMGDPTTEKLLPLIDKAAAVGAETFCIDAGWYDDGGYWWPSVGAWEPSTVRFGELGLPGVLAHIRDRGMHPGLWVEPEVVGVRSPIAQTLPDDAFMTRGGVRIVEQDRYFLDLRSAAARAHLDGVFDRLIGEYGAEYFKWDYNVTPGTGPDADASSPGAGLQAHVEAHLAWFESLRARYPHVTFEACSSGAQRMDRAILDRYDLQSTTDQQDYRLYPVIAAAAPMAMPPEQAGNWAYPQGGWDEEQVAFSLVTGLAGRMYLSGRVDRMDEDVLTLVREAVGVYPEVIAHHAASVPSWPLGLPAWTDPQVALATIAGDDTLLFVWNRDDDATSTVLSVPHLAGADVRIETVFPVALPAWSLSFDRAGTIEVDFAGTGESARVIRVRRAD